jgi:hypothetical protein
MKTLTKSTHDKLQCKYCETWVEKSYVTSVSIVCSSCVSKLVDGKHLELRK